MKNVMKKAWEIARKGQQKFGGKVKEYFADALRMAWIIVKKSMNNNFGFQELGRKNGMVYFVVNDIQGLEVSFLTEEKSIRTGNTYTKRHIVTNFKTGTNNVTGEKARMYALSINCGDIEIKSSNDAQTIKNSR